MSFDRIGQEGKDVAALLAAGFNHRQHGLDEPAAGAALRAERQLSPNHGMTQRTLARVVGRFDPLAPQERPQPRLAVGFLGSRFVDVQVLLRRQSPYLVPQRLRVVARELRPTTPTLLGLARLDVVALLRRNQRPLVLGVAGLPPTLLARLGFRPLRPGVGMLRTGRQRGVLRRLPFRLPLELLDLRLQLSDPRQEQADDSLGLRRLASDDFFRDDRLHTYHCATKPASKSRSVSQENASAV